MPYRISSFRLLMSFTSLGCVAKSACSEVICERSTSTFFVTAVMPYKSVLVNEESKQGVLSELDDQYLR